MLRSGLLVLFLALAFATRANAIIVGGCVDDTDCPGSICGIGVCVNGVCKVGPGNRGKVCRPSTGPCDPAEVCSGTSTVCPADDLAPSTTVCRAAAGACDVPEFCTGTSAACPANQLVAAGTVCNPSKGVCDVAEVCDGVRAACPADAFRPSSTVCRPAAGPCDVAEQCTGTSAACPADGMVASGTVCRPAAGACDVPETCDGSHAACPADALAIAGTVCRSRANDCDLPEACSGSSKDCPADSSAPDGTACENASACVSGGTCGGPVCIGGAPELTFSPDPAELVDAQHDVDVAIKHTGSGAPITLTGASVDPAGTFSIATAPQFPVAVPSGSEVHLTVRLAANATPGEHGATLHLAANGCADQPIQLHATVATPSTDGGTPDAGTSTAPDAGTGASGASTGGSSAKASGGGCSSGAAPTGMLALILLAGFGLRRRRA